MIQKNILLTIILSKRKMFSEVHNQPDFNKMFLKCDKRGMRSQFMSFLVTLLHQ